jgi:hypothetical protein
MVSESQIHHIPKSEEHLLYATFNQDASCIAFGTDKGFSIYSSSPLKEIISRSILFFHVYSHIITYRS